MFDKLEDLLIRFEEIMGELNEPDVTANQERFRALMKEQSDLTPIVEAYREYKKCNQDIEDSLMMLDEENDPDMREMLKEELNSAKTRVSELEEELKAIYAEMPKECVASVGLMRRVPFTQSIGVAGTREVRCKNWDALYDLCEKRLAAAQTAGGDRIYDGE